MVTTSINQHELSSTSIRSLSKNPNPLLGPKTSPETGLLHVRDEHVGCDGKGVVSPTGATPNNMDSHTSHNSQHQNQTPPLNLLSLPPELRNQIYTHVLSAPSLSTPRIRTSSPRFYTTGAQPLHWLALIRTCRQLYSETSLLPLRLVEFYFTSRKCFDWVRKLDPVRQAAIAQVRFVTWGLLCDDAKAGFRPLEFVNEVFPSEVFCGLRRLVVEVRLPCEVEEMRNWERIREMEGVVRRQVREKCVFARIEFEYVKVCMGLSM